MKARHIPRALILVIVASLLVACGTGGGKEGNPGNDASDSLAAELLSDSVSSDADLGSVPTDASKPGDGKDELPDLLVPDLLDAETTDQDAPLPDLPQIDDLDQKDHADEVTLADIPPDNADVLDLIELVDLPDVTDVQVEDLADLLDDAWPDLPVEPDLVDTLPELWDSIAEPLPDVPSPPDFDFDFEFDFDFDGEFPESFIDQGNSCEVDEDCEGSVQETCIGAVACIDGECVFDPEVVKPCPPVDEQCMVNVCVDQVGQCEIQTAPDGASCDDDNSLTMLDVCVGGVCTGTYSVDCDSDADCNDLYNCTDDTCVAGSCLYKPVVCEPAWPEECIVGYCTHEDGCLEKDYLDPDNVIYLEDLTDEMAQGWLLEGATQGLNIGPSPSGYHAVLLELDGEDDLVLRLPVMLIPPAQLVASIGLELFDWQRCGDLELDVLLDGEPLAQLDPCDLLDPQLEYIGTGLGSGVFGEHIIAFQFYNQSDTALEIAVIAARLDMQGGDSCCTDFDLDGVLGCLDNCPDWHNPDQHDCDGDGTGDPCDPDDDDDGVLNQHDEFECDAGSQLAVRRIAGRGQGTNNPVAVACSPDFSFCYLFDISGEHLMLEPYGTPTAVVQIPEVPLVKTAVFCSGWLWLLGSSGTVHGFDVSDPYRPEQKAVLPVPVEVSSLQQGLGCYEGDLILNGAQYLYLLEGGGEYSVFFDVLEPVWSVAFTEDDLFWALSRSPQPPNMFFLRALSIEGEQTIIPLLYQPAEAAPPVEYKDMDFAGWGADSDTGGLWIVSSAGMMEPLQLMDPWRTYYGEADLDGDGEDDQVDDDDDGDGVADLLDFRPLDPHTWKDDDGDGVGNYVDWDDSGNGRSDHYDSLPPLGVSTLFELATEITGIDVHNDQIWLLDSEGQVSRRDMQGNVQDSWDLELLKPDALSVVGDEVWVHDQSYQLMARFTTDGTPLGAYDSPEKGYSILSAATGLAAAEDGCWVGIAGKNRLLFLDPTGNVSAGIRVPGVMRGVELTDSVLTTLVALGDGESALVRVGTGGNLLGAWLVGEGGLTGLARHGNALLTSRTANGVTEIVSIELPPGLSQVEPPVLPLPGQPNAAVLVAPQVPVQIGDEEVTINWLVPDQPELIDSLKLCTQCGNLTSFIPPFKCVAVDLFSGEATSGQLSSGDTCAFELRATTAIAGEIESRRVSATVGQPGSGSAVWSKKGTVNSKSWHLVLVPELLKL